MRNRKCWRDVFLCVYFFLFVFNNLPIYSYVSYSFSFSALSFHLFLPLSLSLSLILFVYLCLSVSLPLSIFVSSFLFYLLELTLSYSKFTLFWCMKIHVFDIKICMWFKLEIWFGKPNMKYRVMLDKSSKINHHVMKTD